MPLQSIDSAGVVLTKFQNESRFTEVHVLPNGKFIVSGTIGRNFALVGFLQDGTIDKGFGQDGVALSAVGSSNYTPSVVLQPDGKILLCGATYEGFSSKFALVRFTSDGKIDNGFDVDGKLTTSIEGGDSAYGLALQADGKIIVTGRVDTGSISTSAPKIGLVRYLPDGRLDVSFDGDGKVTTSVGSFSYAQNIVLQPDGKVLVQAYSNEGSAVLRYLSDGSLDSSFDLDGLAILKLSSNGTKSTNVSLQPDGKIIVSIINYPLGALQENITLRYLSSGKLDSAFGNDGIVKHGGNDVRFQSDGKILLVEPIDSGEIQKLIRLNVDGSIDNTFNDHDIAVSKFTQIDFQILADGRILVIGKIAEGLAMLRFNSDGTRDLSFSPVITQDGSTNSLPYGELTVSSNTNSSLVNVGDVLTASNTITDLDGIGIIKYQWKANGVEIGGATASSYKVQAIDAQKTVSVEAKYIDGKGNLESLLSVSTSPIVLNDFSAPAMLTTSPVNQSKNVPLNSSIVLNFNEPVRANSGTITIKKVSGQTVETFDTATSSNLTFSYDKITIKPTIQFSYNTDYVVEIQKNSLTDQSGNSADLQSIKFTTIAALNHLPTGSVSISGIAYIGQILTASNNLTDVDGIGIVTYQWKVNGEDIVGASTSALSLISAFVGKKISVVATYIDGLNNKDVVATEVPLMIGGYFAGDQSSNVFQGSNGIDFFDGKDGYDTLNISGLLSEYHLSRSGDSVSIRSLTGNEATDTTKNVESLKFQDKTINLVVQGKAALENTANVQKLIELYVAFFNRIPDADGMSYWLDQLHGGTSINSIANSFYNAGIAYPQLTGFSPEMSNTAFVNIIYKNVLGRVDGADADGLAYWLKELSSGIERGALVSTILNSAHSFKGNDTYGYVADLLDNKIKVGKTIAIDWGINFNSNELSISKGMEIAAAITPQDIDVALKLIGVSAQNINLG